MAGDLSRQALVGFTWCTVGFFGAAVTVSSQVASDACFGAMTLSGCIVIVLYLLSARSYDPYRGKPD